MWSGCAFRVILYREGRFILYTDTFNRFIIKIDMGYFHVVRLFDSFRIYTESMVLCSYFAFAGHQVFNRVIEPPMAVVHFEGRDIIGQGQ